MYLLTVEHYAVTKKDNSSHYSKLDVSLFLFCCFVFLRRGEEPPSTVKGKRVPRGRGPMGAEARERDRPGASVRDRRDRRGRHRNPTEEATRSQTFVKITRGPLTFYHVSCPKDGARSK